MSRILESKYKMEFLGRNIAHINLSEESFFAGYYNKKYTKRLRLLHYHDFYELEFIVGGEAVNYINGIKFELHRGMMFLTRPTDIHRYEIEPYGFLQVYTLRFNGEMICDGMVSELLKSDLLVADTVGKFELIKSLIEDVLREYENPDMYSEILYRGITSRLAVFLLRACENKQNLGSGEPFRVSEGNRLAALATNYINTNFGSHITVKSAADTLGVTPNYLGRLFSESMSMTFGQYLKRVRLICAMNRVANSGDTIQGIALDCGFSSQSVFTREFKKYYGRPPVSFRGGALPGKNNEV